MNNVIKIRNVGDVRVIHVDRKPNWYISEFDPDSEEYARLEHFAKMLEDESAIGVRYCVKETYFDCGQGWMWTTIIGNDVRSNWGGWQALNPREQEEVLLADSEDELNLIIDRYFKDKYCQDKRKGN